MSAPQTEPINLASQLRNCVHQYARLTSQKQEEQDNSAKALKQEIIKLKEKLAQETAALTELQAQYKTLQTQNHQLQTQNHQLQTQNKDNGTQLELLKDELIKAEAQITLIHDIFFQTNPFQLPKGQWNDPNKQKKNRQRRARMHNPTQHEHAPAPIATHNTNKPQQTPMPPHTTHPTTHNPSLTAHSPTLERYSQWQFGDWTSLAQTQTTQNEEQHALKASAQLQLGQIDQAKHTLKGLPVPPSEQTARLLISGVFNTLGKAKTILAQPQEAMNHYAQAIDIVKYNTQNDKVIQLRASQQNAAIQHNRQQINSQIPQTNPAIYDYVDIIGPSGSGKTTLIKALEQQHGFITANQLKKRESKDADGKIILNFLKHYPKYISQIQHTLESSELTSGWFAGLIQDYMKASHTDQNLLLDEGFVCRLNAVFGYQQTPLEQQKIDEYLDAIPHPKCLIIIKPETADIPMQRMQQREKGLPERMRTLTPLQQQQVMHNQMQMLEWVETYFENKITQIIVCNAGLTPNELKNNIVNQILADQKAC